MVTSRALGSIAMSGTCGGLTLPTQTIIAIGFRGDKSDRVEDTAIDDGINRNPVEQGTHIGNIVFQEVCTDANLDEFEKFAEEAIAGRE